METGRSICRLAAWASLVGLVPPSAGPGCTGMELASHCRGAMVLAAAVGASSLSADSMAAAAAEAAAEAATARLQRKRPGQRAHYEPPDVSKDVCWVGDFSKDTCCQ
ncbi:unnamed protein product, partial [Polarella glacialis]